MSSWTNCPECGSRVREKEDAPPMDPIEKEARRLASSFRHELDLHAEEESDIAREIEHAIRKFSNTGGKNE